MAEIHQIVTELKELEELLINCMHCGMCQAVCPVFENTMKEADVARGKILLLEGLAKKMIDCTHDVKESLDKCLLCGSCQSNCPSGVKTLDIFLKARAILTAFEGLSGSKKLVFRGMLSHPTLFNTVLSLGATFQGLFLSTADDYVGTSCAKMLEPMIGERHFKKLAKTPFRKKHTARDTPRGKSGLKVAFYYGCVVDKMNPEIGDAVIKILDHHGVGVYMPHGQACCGIPALASGDAQTFDTLLQKNLELFAGKDFDAIITPCATCTSTIAHTWPLFSTELPVTQKEAIKEISDKTMDISQFLVEKVGVKLESPNKDGKTKVTYHDPCHLKKSLGVSKEPRELMQMNSDVNFVEMKGADDCCGCGGSFTLFHYDVSSAVGAKKRNNVVDTGADVVATSCPACMMQLTNQLSLNHDRVKVKHVVELYADSL